MKILKVAKTLFSSKRNSKKIQFVDFWKGFDPKQDVVFGEMIKKYDLVLSESPDILFFSVFGNENLKYGHSKKVFYSSENLDRYSGKEFSYDFSITHEINSFKNHFRLPNYIRRYGFEIQDEINNRDPNIIEQVLNNNRNFCSYITSNKVEFRDNVFQFLDKEMGVDSFGKNLNNKNLNVPYSPENKAKVDILRKYSFNLCFENSECDGYVTEKIIDSFKAFSIPIYWGPKDVNNYINPKSYIHYRDFNNKGEFLQKLKQIYSNKNACKDLLMERPLTQIINKNSFYTFLDNFLKN